MKDPRSEAIGILTSVLQMTENEARDLLSKRGVRLLSFEGVRYVSFRRAVRGLEEGTLIAWSGGEVRIVYGYPSIRRVLIPEVALPRWFPGPEVVLEEKMNGYNVRVFALKGRIFAVTRGGLICPYTTRRLRRLHGEGLLEAIRTLGGEEEYVIAGEVVGMENPYTRYSYPEARDFGYFVFDAFRGPEPLPLKRRDDAVESGRLRRVRTLAVINKRDLDTFWRVLEELEEEGREGVIAKDHEYRVPPLKYTTSHTNVGDLELGMQYPFDEGRSFLFSRIIREVFKYWQGRGAPPGDLGRAILFPAVESVERVSRGQPLVEELTLTMHEMNEVEELVEYFTRLQVPVTLKGVELLNDGLVRATFVKAKESDREIRRILRTGLSPVD